MSACRRGFSTPQPAILFVFGKQRRSLDLLAVLGLDSLYRRVDGCYRGSTKAGPKSRENRCGLSGWRIPLSSRGVREFSATSVSIGGEESQEGSRRSGTALKCQSDKPITLQSAAHWRNCLIVSMLMESLCFVTHSESQRYQPACCLQGAQRLRLHHVAHLCSLSLWVRSFPKILSALR